MSMTSDQLSRWLWQAGVWGLVGVAAATLVTLALALSGAFDPKPAGSLVLDQAPAGLDWQVWPGDALCQTRDGTLVVTAPSAHTRIWVDTGLRVSPPFTLEITARQIGGPREAGYGLWWGEAIGSEAAVIVVNGNDYFGVFRGEQAMEPVIAWQTFPHVRSQGQVNRLRVDLGGDRASVRVNDEIAATFDGPPRAGRFGFYVETSNRGGSLVAFEWVQVWEQSLQ
jgi:hypothetical protein